MIVRGDRLAESVRVNRLRLEHAGLWALLLSNPRLVDDFGLLRWDPAQLLTALFPRRRPAPVRAVRTFMRAVEEVGLVKVYEVEGVRFAEIHTWSGVEPAKRRWHRSPLPSWKKHECHASCATSGVKVAVTWHQGFAPEVGRTNAPDESSDVSPPFGSPTSAGSSGPFGSSGNGCFDGREVLEKGLVPPEGKPHIVAPPGEHTPNDEAITPQATEQEEEQPDRVVLADPADREMAEVQAQAITSDDSRGLTAERDTVARFDAERESAEQYDGSPEAAGLLMVLNDLGRPPDERLAAADALQAYDPAVLCARRMLRPRDLVPK